jgi:hypothetical protein
LLARRDVRKRFQVAALNSFTASIIATMFATGVPAWTL